MVMVVSCRDGCDMSWWSWHAVMVVTCRYGCDMLPVQSQLQYSTCGTSACDSFGYFRNVLILLLCNHMPIPVSYVTCLLHASEDIWQMRIVSPFSEL